MRNCVPENAVSPVPPKTSWKDSFLQLNRAPQGRPQKSSLILNGFAATEKKKKVSSPFPTEKTFLAYSNIYTPNKTLIM